MSYLTRLSLWCIVRQLPNLKSPIVARFRRRNDAEAHLQILQRLMPHASFLIVFDLEPQD
jgi:hypothetical protein